VYSRNYQEISKEFKLQSPRKEIFRQIFANSAKRLSFKSHFLKIHRPIRIFGDFFERLNALSRSKKSPKIKKLLPTRHNLTNSEKSFGLTFKGHLLNYNVWKKQEQNYQQLPFGNTLCWQKIKGL